MDTILKQCEICGQHRPDVEDGQCGWCRHSAPLRDRAGRIVCGQCRSAVARLMAVGYHRCNCEYCNVGPRPDFGLIKDTSDLDRDDTYCLACAEDDAFDEGDVRLEFHLPDDEPTEPTVRPFGNILADEDMHGLKQKRDAFPK
jgi:hypothetical protein